MGIQIKRCVIVSGAPEEDIAYYRNYMDNCYIIAADSGYKKCALLGIEPHLIIGDFDSAPMPQTDIETLTLPVMKDDTDTFFCVKEAIKRDCNDITILGGIGTRLDHTYSNILCLDYCLERGVKCRLVNKSNLAVIMNDKIVIHNNDYKYFSLFALYGKCEGLSVSGAVYNLDSIDLEPCEQFTQSNRIKDHTATVSIKKGKILLIQSND